MKHILIFVFFSFSLFGNSFPKMREPHFRPSVIEYFPDGSVKHVIYFVPNGEKEKGVKECFFYENGALKEEIDLNDKEYHGASLSFYPSGQIAKIAHYENGLLVDEIETFYPSGFLKEKGFYQDGKKEGTFEQFFPDGTKKEIGTYKKGKKEGDYLTFFEDGSKASKIHFKQGLPDGEAFEWYEGGIQLKKISHFISGHLHNVNRKPAVTLFEKNGKIKEVKNFRLGICLDPFIPKKEKKDLTVKKLSSKKMAPENVKDGEHRLFFPDGKLKEIFYLENGVPVGEHKEYYQEPHTLHRLFHYVSGQFDGEQTIFYPDGSLAGLITYSEGVLHGKKNKWNENHELIEEGTFENGYLVGRYFQKNDLNEVCIFHYKNGKKEGLHQIFYPSGVKKFEAHYKEDKLNGVISEYSEKGFKVAEYNFIDGKKEGLASLFADDGFYNGTTLATIPYKSGVKEGKAQFYYPDGKIFKEITYKNDLREGFELAFFETGSKASSYAYKGDILDGLCQEWDAEGTLIFEAQYKEGKINGPIFKKKSPFSAQIGAQIGAKVFAQSDAGS